MSHSLSKIADHIGADLIGNASITIQAVAAIDKATEGQISFISNKKYLQYLSDTNASAVIVSEDMVLEKPPTNLLVVRDVYLALSQLLVLFDHSSDIGNFGSGERTAVSSDVSIPDSTVIGEFSIVEKGVQIGENCIIAPQVYLGKNVKLGTNCRIYPGVKIYHGCIVGDNVTIHANAIIGSDGFGYAPAKDGTFHKIPQIGIVRVEDNVEIGANTVIDRATLGETIIGEGTKLDNLIQIAHNVELGKHNVIAAQAGIAGSTKIGNYCQIGGQAGIVGHLKIADQTMIQAQSGMSKSVGTKATKWYGTPAIEYNNYLKSFAIYKNLPDLQSRIDKLEKLLSDIQLSLKK